MIMLSLCAIATTIAHPNSIRTEVERFETCTIVELCPINHIGFVISKLFRDELFRDTELKLLGWKKTAELNIILKVQSVLT
jgi:hypothetical protein